MSTVNDVYIGHQRYPAVNVRSVADELRAIGARAPDPPSCRGTPNYQQQQIIGHTLLSKQAASDPWSE